MDDRLPPVIAFTGVFLHLLGQFECVDAQVLEVRLGNALVQDAYLLVPARAHLDGGGQVAWLLLLTRCDQLREVDLGHGLHLQSLPGRLVDHERDAGCRLRSAVQLGCH